MSVSGDRSQWLWELVAVTASLALAGLQRAFRSYQRRRSETWPISYGRILSASADEKDKSIILKAAYGYSANSQSYGGTFKKTFTDLDEADGWAEALRGKQVAIRYDPNKPSRSQVWESDLEPMVQASAAAWTSRYQDIPELPSWERALLSLGFVLALAGTSLSVFAITAGVLGKPVAGSILKLLSVGALPLLAFGAWEGWRGGARVLRATPEWMKYLGIAIFYYVMLSSVFLPMIPSKPGTPSSHRQSGSRESDYQLLLYVGALEAFYARLHAAQRRDEMRATSG